MKIMHVHDFLLLSGKSGQFSDHPPHAICNPNFIYSSKAGESLQYILRQFRCQKECKRGTSSCSSRFECRDTHRGTPSALPSIEGVTGLGYYDG